MSLNYDEKYKDLIFNFSEEEKEIEIIAENLENMKINFEEKSQNLKNFLNEQFDLKNVRNKIKFSLKKLFKTK